MKFSCKTHGVTLTIEGKRRHIVPPPVSLGTPCKLMTLNPVTDGQHGDCEIVKEQ